jgi:hypothetical protein
VDAPGNHGKASMPEQVKRPNPWKKKIMIMTLAPGTFAHYVQNPEVNEVVADEIKMD